MNRLEIIIPSLKDFLQYQEKNQNILLKYLKCINTLKQQCPKNQLTPFSQYPIISDDLLKRIFAIINIDLPQSIKKEDLSIEFWRFYLSVEIGDMIPGQRIKRGNQDTFLCIILEGTVDLEFGNNIDLNKSVAGYKKHARKRNNRISHFSSMNQDDIRPVAQISTSYNIRAVTTGKFLKFPKKKYQNLKEWIKYQQQKNMLQFLSSIFNISIDQIKLFRIHRKYTTKKINSGERIQFQDENNKQMLVLLKGQFLLNYYQKSKQQSFKYGYSQQNTQQMLKNLGQISNSKSSLINYPNYRCWSAVTNKQKGSKPTQKSQSIFISKGGIINNTGLRICSNIIVNSYGIATKQCSFIVFTKEFIQELCQNSKNIKDKLKKNHQKIQNNRLKFIRPQSGLNNFKDFSHPKRPISDLNEDRKQFSQDNKMQEKQKNKKGVRYSQNLEPNLNNNKIQIKINFEGFKKQIPLVPRDQKRFSNKNKFRATTQGDQSKKVLDKKYQSFISIYPYNKIAESQLKIYKVQSSREKIKNQGNKQTFDKIKTYIKQSKLKQQKQNQKALKLRLQRMAQKTMPNDKRQSTFYSATNFLKKGLFDEDLQQNKFQEENLIDQSFSSNLKKKEILLSNNDTGIINEFIKGSRVYQKQLDNILKEKQSREINQKNKFNKYNNFFTSSFQKLKNQDNQNYSSNLFTHQILKNLLDKRKSENIQFSQNQDNQTYNQKKPILYNKFITQWSNQEQQFRNSGPLSQLVQNILHPYKKNCSNSKSFKNILTSKGDFKKQQKKIIKRASSGKMIKVKYKA